MGENRKPTATLWSLFAALCLILGFVDNSWDLFGKIRELLAPSQKEQVIVTAPSANTDSNTETDNEIVLSQDDIVPQIDPKQLSFKQRWAERAKWFSKTEGFKEKFLFPFHYFPRWGLICLILTLLMGCAGPFIEPFWDIDEKGTVSKWIISIAFWAVSTFVILNGLLQFLIEIGDF